VFVFRKSYPSTNILIVNIIKKIRTICFLLFTSIFSNRYIAQFFIDARVNRILSNLHNLVEGFSGNNETADRLNKKIIKSLIKFQVLYNNRNMFSPDDLQLLMNFRRQFDLFTENMFELYDFDIMLNRFLLRRKCKECQKLIHKIIANRLTQKSHERIDFIVNFISNEQFVKYVFDSKSAFNHSIIKEIIVDFRGLVNDGLI
jgi:hypothetical protein